ncbi:uncharacterized protein PV09_05712 [Verruconis gallopava]|uniref:Uncharacterized protein n=1 Tax=Verruconis gallopava TaxID=253628 RepID=A0A0D2A8J4_9PEZI|nr:uncharacterized protein PV09_05712 [Verruconis gallopava]KIW03063.1 hypothetical protein PV09_05712 [Verruconis gallopava]
MTASWRSLVEKRRDNPYWSANKLRRASKKAGEMILAARRVTARRASRIIDSWPRPELTTSLVNCRSGQFEGSSRRPCRARLVAKRNEKENGGHTRYRWVCEVVLHSHTSVRISTPMTAFSHALPLAPPACALPTHL